MDSHAHSADQALCRGVFITTKPDATFAMVHFPSQLRADATGVIMCPPFAGEELFTYQTRRTWAESLAHAGHPTLRLDLPGTGDSAGWSRSPDRLLAWKTAVSGAAAWLRHESGCARIAALGIGFGGMMAWLAAAEGAPIDDLILWGTPISGRRLVRELRTAAGLDIVRDLELEALAEPDSSILDDESLLDEAGQVTSKETVDALMELELTELDLAEPTRRRVLLFERDGAATDRQVCAYFQGCGTEVTVADGNAYWAMMQYVELAELPEAAIARSVAWLAGSDEFCASAMPPGRRGTPVTAVSAIEMQHGGATIRETILTTEVGAVTLRGILAEPVDASPAGFCVVFFAGAADRRTGPNRLWVELARRWAAKGVASVRIDPEGIGDSDGDATLVRGRRRHYDPRHVPKTVALLDALVERGLRPRFVLVGFCSGAYRSFQVARVDDRIAGVFAVNVPCFFSTRWTANVRHAWVRAWRRRTTDSPLKAAAIWTLRCLWRAAERARRLYRLTVGRCPDRLDRTLDHLRDQGTELLLLFKSNSLEYRDLCRGEHRRRLSSMPKARVERIPGPDSRFRPPALQRFVSDRLEEALDRVLASEGSAGRPAEAHRDRAGANPAARTGARIKLDGGAATGPGSLTPR